MLGPASCAIDMRRWCTDAEVQLYGTEQGRRQQALFSRAGGQHRLNLLCWNAPHNPCNPPSRCRLQRTHASAQASQHKHSTTHIAEALTVQRAQHTGACPCCKKTTLTHWLIQTGAFKHRHSQPGAGSATTLHQATQQGLHLVEQTDPLPFTPAAAHNPVRDALPHLTQQNCLQP